MGVSWGGSLGEPWVALKGETFRVNVLHSELAEIVYTVSRLFG